MYIDQVLPFGLHSAPKIFSAITDAIQCILHKKSIKKGYADDFIQ